MCNSTNTVLFLDVEYLSSFILTSSHGTLSQLPALYTHQIRQFSLSSTLKMPNV